MPRVLLSAGLAAVLVASPALISGQQKAAHHWTYEGEEGPIHWGDLDPAYSACKSGTEQAPIDIIKPVAASLPPIRFDYKPSPLAIVDNGHSVQINYGPGSSIDVAGHRYELKQFHFHHPSENKIHGKQYSLEIHFVHADSEGKQAVVGILVDRGAASPAIQALWENLPTTKNQVSRPPGVSVNAADFLPAERGYYTFPGSLTTPPCSEGLSWYLLKTADEASSGQIEAFAKLYPMNARPTQPLHQRMVRESK